jgi:hypothetical protein
MILWYAATKKPLPRAGVVSGVAANGECRGVHGRAIGGEGDLEEGGLERYYGKTMDVMCVN